MLDGSFDVVVVVAVVAADTSSSLYSDAVSNPSEAASEAILNGI